MAQITRRHMIVARLKNPTNMGANASQVRIFVLIVTPSVEKVTKDSLETGRTFATMLADQSFRQSLLRACDKTEFRAMMVVRAQQLSGRCTVKNRTKYPYDPALQSAVFSLVGMSGNLICPIGEQAAMNVSSDRSTPSLIGEQQVSKTNHLYISRMVLKNANPLASQLVLGHLPGHKFEHQGLQDLKDELSEQTSCCSGLEFGKGIQSDFKRRLRFYISDYRDAFIGPPRTVQKTIATIWFLYFSILLPTIAFSSLNLHQTHGHMGDLRKALVGQVIGGLSYALIGGQPLVIVMTTAPLCLYTKGKLIDLSACQSLILNNY